MWDHTVTMIELAMRADSLENLPSFELPAQYDWRFYQPGDERAWAEVETSAEEFRDPADGVKAFYRYFPDEDALKQRMIFLTDRGVPFSTATAWFTEDGVGQLHWVSVDAAHQGYGLSKAVVSLAMRRMRELGHTSAWLTTQTPSWVAIRVYHMFGFRPEIREEKELEGWKIVSDKTGIDFLRKIR